MTKTMTGWDLLETLAEYADNDEKALSEIVYVQYNQTKNLDCFKHLKSAEIYHDNLTGRTAIFLKGE